MANLSKIKEQLFLMQDLKYKEFHTPLIPTVCPQKIIGIKTPVLRKFARGFNDKKLVEEFLNNLPHYYYEENNLHAFLIEKISDYFSCVSQLNKFLPFIDNWATCDMMNPKVLLKDKSLLKKDVLRWLKSTNVYEIRFAIICSMRAFLGCDFDEEIALKIASIKSDEYYVNSAIGWFFATLITKNEQIGVQFIVQNKLNATCHNLAIKKARESKIVKKQTKDYLKTLKR